MARALAKKVETSTMLLEAAKKVLRQKGYANLSTRDVAAAAGVPLSQIHYHFGSKQGMVLALFVHLNAQLLGRQNAMFSNPALKLSEQWDLACDYLDEDIASGYVRVLQELEQRWQLQPLILGGPSQVERRMADEILARSGTRAIDCLGDDVRRLVWLLDGCALTISPDTGPLHISRALETPVIGLYGTTNPKRTGPYRRFHDLIVDAYGEPGENYPISMDNRLDRMPRITVRDVIERVERWKQRYAAAT